MREKYDKFLTAKPKIFGINIMDVYLSFLFWIFLAGLGINDITRLPMLAMFSAGLIYYNKRFTEGFLYFYLNKRNTTLIEIKNQNI